MPLKIELQGRGAGSGVLRVQGAPLMAESVALTLQRNDGLYLGPDQVWQTTPHWHPQFGVQAVDERLQMDLVGDLIDGVIAAGGVPLRVTLRVDGSEDYGVLRIRGQLIGSGAAMDASPEPDLPELVAEPAADVLLDSEPTSEPVSELDAPPESPPGPTDRARRRAIWPWLLLALLLLGGLAAWYFGGLDRWVNAPATALAQQPAPDSGLDGDEVPQVNTAPTGDVPEPESEQAQAPVSARPPESVGVEFVRAFLATSPDPAAIFEQGGRSEQAHDCDAALLLFNTAANRDTAMAAALARRYDPRGFEPGSCITAPDAAYAIIFYADAADAGDPVAQSRLGQLMTAREPSGPTFEEGMDWLRRAAQAGDEQARIRLEQLEN